MELMDKQTWINLLVLIGCLFLPVLNANVVVQVQNQVGMCRKGDDCGEVQGQVCRLRFEPCNLGTCMCPMGMVENTETRQCVKEVMLEEECETMNQCLSINNAHCNNGFCQCRASHKPYLGGCMKDTQFKVGEMCSITVECVYYDEHNKVITGTSCTDGVCLCPEHMITEKEQCKTREISDTCRVDAQCGGINGAICNDGTCQCQNEYVEVMSKHCRLKSTIGISDAGDFCATDGSCKEEFVCRRCHDKSKNKTCVYLSSGGSQASIISSHVLVILLVAMVTFSTKLC